MATCLQNALGYTCEQLQTYTLMLLLPHAAIFPGRSEAEKWAPLHLRLIAHLSVPQNSLLIVRRGKGSILIRMCLLGKLTKSLTASSFFHPSLLPLWEAWQQLSPCSQARLSPESVLLLSPLPLGQSNRTGFCQCLWVHECRHIRRSQAPWSHVFFPREATFPCMSNSRPKHSWPCVSPRVCVCVCVARGALCFSC